MQKPLFQRFLILITVFLGIWLALRYLFPLAMPFLLGAGLAFAAEPLVRLSQKYARLPRSISAGIGVTVTLLLTVALVIFLAALLVRELSLLAGIVPDLGETVRQGLALLESWLLGLINRTPDGIKGILTQSVSGLFSGGSAFLDRASRWVLNLASAVLVRLPDSALGLGTCILASYMISAKFPSIRSWFSRIIPQTWKDRYLPTLVGLKNALLGWLRAQAKLACVTFLIVTAGFLILKINYAPLWAFILALVDAVPLLGTGIVLIPWSLVSLLQGNHVRSLGLLLLYAAAALTRSALEPKLVGKQLGLDPLLTLAALYTGYRLWGIGGMILSPLIAVTAVQLTERKL